MLQYTLIASVLLCLYLPGSAQEQIFEVTADVETKSNSVVYDADDSCIWIHPTDPSMSVVIGTDKKKGISVYDLSGNELHQYSLGRLNNVDLRYNFPLGQYKVDLIAAGNRINNTIMLFMIEPKTRRLLMAPAQTIRAGIILYGLCMYHSPKTGKFYVFITSEAGNVEQWELFDDGGKIKSKRVRSITVGSQSEGCVADDEHGALYIAEENVGIWRYNAEPDGGVERVAVDRVGERLQADVEGLTIYYGPDGSGYLIASSQGANKYMIYDRKENHYIASFRITGTNNIDGTEETDGIDVCNVSLGKSFPFGLFVAQDGGNEGRDDTNFKLVSWQRIAETIQPPLMTETGWNPRR